MLSVKVKTSCHKMLLSSVIVWEIIISTCFGVKMYNFEAGQDGKKAPHHLGGMVLVQWHPLAAHWTKSLLFNKHCALRTAH